MHSPWAPSFLASYPWADSSFVKQGVQPTSTARPYSRQQPAPSAPRLIGLFSEVGIVQLYGFCGEMVPGGGQGVTLP